MDHQQIKNSVFASLKKIVGRNHFDWVVGDTGFFSIVKGIDHFELTQLVQIANYFGYRIEISGYAENSFYVELDRIIYIEFEKIL